jgi:lipopolysaccharide/colanic/teichoic acid biosynthesis glycosyltransferase
MNIGSQLDSNLLKTWVKTSNNPDIIPSRLWLRKTGLDELPQIINIVLGDMNFFWSRATQKEMLSRMTVIQRNRYISRKPGIIGAYLFDWRFDGDTTKMNDAYLRLLSKKEGEWFIATLQMNMSALWKSIAKILDWTHS